MVANAAVIRAAVAFMAFNLTLHGAWLAAVVYAFDRGGAKEAGIVAVATLIPGALLSPFVTVWFDRYPPNLALAGGFVFQGAALIGMSVAIASGIPRFSVYALMGLWVIVMGSSRPTMSAVLPRIVIDPTELAAANAIIGTIETLGLALGPAAAGLIFYTVDSEYVAFVGFGVAMLAAAAVAVTIRMDPRMQEVDDIGIDIESTSVSATVVAGLRLLGSMAGPRHLVILMAAAQSIVGVLEVGVVVIAIDHMGRSDATAGVLAAAIGIGAIGGSALTFGFVGRRRLSPWIAVGALCATAPIALVAATTDTVVIVALMVVAGLGRPLVAVAGRTLLQGLSTDDVLARVFGVFEGLAFFAVALGSAAFALIAEVATTEAALVITAAVPCAIAIALLGRIRRIDDARPAIDAELLATMRTIPIFTPLAAFRVEQMLVNMQKWTFGPNAPVFNKGDQGDELFVVTSGWAHIDLDGDAVGTRRGGFFGEIALLRDQPRMASVRAGSEGMTAYTLDRETFMSAIATAPLSSARSERVVAQRLGEAG